MDSEQLRGELETLLNTGLDTDWQERPATSEDQEKIIARLQVIESDDYPGKLKLAGFLNHPYATRDDNVIAACESCMYYEIHRQHCILPELDLPVAYHWSCRLWRI